MKYINHYFLNKKCIFCNIIISNLLKFYNKKCYSIDDLEEAFHSIPCLSEDEYIIKQIIE